MTASMKDELRQVLTPLLGEGVEVENLHTLTGGASRTTYAFDAVRATGRRALILRTAPAAEYYAGMELEAAAQAAAAEAGAPVPTILAASDSAEPLGVPYLICDEVPGEAIVRRIQRRLDDPGRTRLLTQCAGALAAIHRARTDAPGLTAQDQIGQYRQRLDDIADTTSTFEFAFRWLERHRPVASGHRLVHGDFRMGNLIVEGSELAAVLDWELVHIGEAYEDLAWFCIRAWRFGAPATRAAGGLGSVDDFVTAYEAAGGTRIDRGVLHWWLVLATLRWGIICRLQAQRHLSGETRSVELATIGRRVCETEWDILDLLAANHHGPPPTGTAPASSTRRENILHGRPTAAELVAAVAEFLAGDVRAHTSGAVNFHALVAANALRIVERELLDDHAEPEFLGYPDESALAAAIRMGEFDGREADVVSCLRVVVGRRLAVAHPGYAEGD